MSTLINIVNAKVDVCYHIMQNRRNGISIKFGILNLRVQYRGAKL